MTLNPNEAIRLPVNYEDGGLASIVTGTPGAVLLDAIGCPKAAWDGEDMLVPLGFDSWGAAVTLPGPLLGDDGVLHERDCDRPDSLRSPGVEDLLLVSGRKCPCFLTGEVAALPSAVSISSLQQLLHDAETLWRHWPLGADTASAGVLADVRSARLGAGLAAALRRFADANTLPPLFDEAVYGCRSRLEHLGRRAAAALAKNGLLRLREHMAARFAAPGPPPDAVSRGRHAQRGVTPGLAAAEAFVPGSGTDHVLCMFEQPGPRVNAAVAAAPIAASREFGRAPFNYLRAAAVLPREVAVLLYADWSVYYVPRTQSMAFATVVDPDWPGLAQACETAVSLWSQEGASPRDSWQAALAATT